ncbi:hypothetical protein ABKV19_005665 [Rosa sericea]
MEPGREEFHPSSQQYMPNSLSSMHSDMRSHNLNTSENKPVHNYSITGEEFSLEFMLDRVNPRKPLHPNAVGDPSYVELKGMLGISHGGFESGSDASMVAISERGPNQFERNSSYLHDDRNNYGSVQSVPRASSGYGNSRVHGYASSGASDSSSMRMKVLCSFGGKILPRPSDGKLRYVGGDTRIIRIRKDITWQELIHKALSIYNQLHIIKYQLPGEELDALVSVSCDEDLQNMMEEWNELEDKEGPHKLRMFFFSISDLEDQFGLHTVDGDSEVQYVVAVNGMDLGSRKNSTLHGLTSSAANHLDETNRHNIQKGTSSVAKDSIGIGAPVLTGKIISATSVQSSEPMLPSSSNAYEAYPHFQHGQVMHYGQNVHYPLHNGHAFPSQSHFGDAPISVPHHGIMNQGGGSIEGQTSGLRERSFEMPVKEVQPLRDGSVQQESDPEKLRPSRKEQSVPKPLYDGNLMNYTPVEEASKDERKYQEPENVASSIDSGKSMLVHNPSEVDHQSTSNNAFAPTYADPMSNGIDLGYLEPPVQPQRIYYSERIPREQAELLNRSSKSDDSHGAQFLVSHSRSDIIHQDPITGVKKLHDHANLPPRSEQQSSSTVNVDAQTVDDGLAQLQKYKEFADSICEMNAKLLQDEDGELKPALPNPVDTKEITNRDKILKSDQETNCLKGSHKKLVVDDIAEAVSEYPAVSQIPFVKHHEVSASNHSELNQAEATGKDPNTADNMGHAQVGVSTPVQGDIIIDIEERFPRDFLSDIFSKAILSEGSPDVGLLQKDGAGLSLNMENHDPKRWSYFQKLDQEGADQQDVSLMDQDLGFPSAIRNVEEEDSKSYHRTPLPTDGAPMARMNSQPNFGEDISKETGLTKANYDHPQLKETESMQFEAMMENLRVPESDYEEGKFASRTAGLPPLNPSLGDFDISTLQLIKNEDLEQMKELGSGTFGTVYHGKWRGSDVAIKRLNKSCFTGRSSEQERLSIEFWREADILSKLHHPNVVAFYGVVQDGPGGTLATVTEYMVDGSLRHVLLRKDRYLDRRKRLIIAMDAAFGMEYLHSKNIVHFDLKCDNLLVNLKDPQRPICKRYVFHIRSVILAFQKLSEIPWFLVVYVERYHGWLLSCSMEAALRSPKRWIFSPLVLSYGRFLLERSRMPTCTMEQL